MAERVLYSPLPAIARAWTVFQHRTVSPHYPDLISLLLKVADMSHKNPITTYGPYRKTTWASRFFNSQAWLATLFFIAGLAVGFFLKGAL